MDSDRASRVQLTLWAGSSGRTGRPFLSGADFLEEVRQLAAGVVLVELARAGMDGFELIEAVTQSGYDLPVVALLAEPDTSKAVTCLRRGAVDVALRGHSMDAIHEAVAYAERVLEVRRPMAQQFRKDAAALHRLTHREREVLDCVASGLTTKSISERMALSARTVEFYRASVVDKLDCATSAGAIATIVRYRTLIDVRASLGALAGVQLAHLA